MKLNQNIPCKANRALFVCYVGGEAWSCGGLWGKKKWHSHSISSRIYGPGWSSMQMHPRNASSAQTIHSEAPETIRIYCHCGKLYVETEFCIKYFKPWIKYILWYKNLIFYCLLVYTFDSQFPVP